MKREQVKRWLLWALAAAATLLTASAVGMLVHRSWTDLEPRFHDSFGRYGEGQSQKGGWQAFGGTWQVVNGAMQNISDDRGAKLMNGSTRWHNYIVEADIQLLGEGGDAGFVLRASQEEVGVDSYHGYFAGLRDLDDTLILGRADFGWHEYQAIPVQPGVYTGTWYHLKFLAYECSFAASSTTASGQVTTAVLQDPECIQKGRFGLQSYSTGAVWRNVEVRPASEDDLQAMLASRGKKAPEHEVSWPGISDQWSEQRYFEPMRRELQDHKTDLSALAIANLRLLAPNLPSNVTVHGVVTLVSPILFVQDSTGGVAINAVHTSKPVQIGDAVEVRGDAELHDFSSILRNADVRLLWSHTPVPPVSVTASQAATGVLDAQFIETEGRLVSEQRVGGRSLMLKLDEGSQSFVAIAEYSSLAEALNTFKKGSRLRLRGICVTDRQFARDEMPFALLMRSVEDVQMVEPPPWWNTEHVIELICGFIALSFGLHLLYVSIKRSQLRAVMEERERLALEMHDTLAQSFAGLGFQLETLSEEFDPGDPMRAQLESTVDLVRFGHTEARRNIAALRPGVLEQMGLAKALEHAARTIVQGGPITILLSVRGDQKQVPLRIADTLFRIGQEAVANAVRHARPRTIHLRLVYGRPSVKLTVRDDGDGFSPHEESTGFGIRGMKRRADSIGAAFRIRSSPGHGTSVAVRAMMPKTLLSSWWRRTMRWVRWRRWLHGKV
ncbi:MAG: histidine kinase [Terracidiphilus sp.]|nr:histidine kinase [Terracidiphilus sp.]MDR3775723.1 histidine kinase [Terracidiphilus sp.]